MSPRAPHIPLPTPVFFYTVYDKQIRNAYFRKSQAGKKLWIHQALLSNKADFILNRADSRLAPSQWETSLHSNAVSHWLGAKLESALLISLEQGIPFNNSLIQDVIFILLKMLENVVSHEQPCLFRRQWDKVPGGHSQICPPGPRGWIAVWAYVSTELYRSFSLV